MAAKARTLFLSLAAFCLPVLANVAVAEKPHLSFAGFVPTSHRGLVAAKPLIAPGIPGCLCDFGGRSRSTGKERDVETGLDYFGARYMSAAQGRFTSADAPFADQHLWDPQSWNLYGYARNNPLRNVDVDGNAAVAVELLRNGQQTFNIPNPGSKLLGAVMIGVGATAAYATDAGFRSDVNRSVSAGVNAFLQAAPNTAYGDPGGLGPIANDGWFMSQDANSSGNGGNNPSGQPGGPGNAAGDPNDPQRKRNGATTEPNLPGKTIVKQDGVTIEHYTRSGDHGPPHMHVSGQGSSTRIGQMGKPLSGDPPLSSRQAQVVQDNRSAIRKAADQIGRWFRFNEE